MSEQRLRIFDEVTPVPLIGQLDYTQLTFHLPGRLVAWATASPLPQSWVMVVPRRPIHGWGVPIPHTGPLITVGSEAIPLDGTTMVQWMAPKLQRWYLPEKGLRLLAVPIPPEVLEQIPREWLAGGW